MLLPIWRFKALSQPNAVSILIALLLGLAFTGRVWAATTGLDPSWQIALTQAHEQSLIWGKDFLFTYGPLSYLFFGSLLKQGQYLEMQMARLLVSVGFFFLALRFISQIERNILKLLGAVALIIIPIAVDDMTSWDDKREIYFVLLSLLIIFDIYRSSTVSQTLKQDAVNQVKSWAGLWLKFYCYGVTGALFLLIKFNVGLLAFVGFLTVALANILTAYVRREPGLSASAVALNSLLSGICVSLLLYVAAPTRLTLLTILALYSLGFLALLGTNLIRHRFSFFWTGLIDKLLNFRTQAILAGILGGVILLLFLSNSALRNFLLGSLQLSSGYSQSMGTVGAERELTAGIIISVAIAFISGLAAFYQMDKLGVCVCLLLFVLGSFKHGFVRHDVYHVVLFTSVAPAYIFIASRLLFNRLTVQPRLKSLLKVLVAAAAACSLLLLYWSGPYNLSSYLLRLSPTGLVENTAALIQPQTTAIQLVEQGTRNLKPSGLTDPSALTALSSQTVDILPWEVSVMQANALNWHPAPNFQIYSVYTRWLDRKNLDHYRQSPPAKIIYSLMSIDGRHPYFDQPLTQAFLLCNYQPLTQPAQLTQSMGEATILQRRAQPICDPERSLPVAEQTVAWGEPVDLNAIRASSGAASGSRLVAKIDLRYSISGKLINFLFRTPPVYLNVRYADGQVSLYRIVIDSAQSDLIVGGLPTSLAGALKDFEGQDSPNPVIAIAMVSPNPSAFQPQIHLTVSRILLAAPQP